MKYFMSDTPLAGILGSPRGLPRGERRNSGESEPCRLRRGEGYGACGDAELLGPGEFSASQFSAYSAVAFGCPAMGSEVLEEAEFDPALEGSLGGKRIALFGSYGWGDGQWMRDWCKRCDDAGANLLEEHGLMVNEAPGAEGEEACKELGRNFICCGFCARAGSLPGTRRVIYT